MAAPISATRSSGGWEEVIGADLLERAEIGQSTISLYPHGIPTPSVNTGSPGDLGFKTCTADNFHHGDAGVALTRRRAVKAIRRTLTLRCRRVMIEAALHFFERSRRTQNCRLIESTSAAIVETTVCFKESSRACPSGLWLHSQSLQELGAGP